MQATHESKLPYYGTVGGRLVAGRKGLYEISEVLEKPTPTEAEQRLIVPGLRAGHYLCFFGMHVLTPAVMELLEEEVARAGERGVHLTTALARLAKRERYLACELEGRRYDIGVKYGLLTAQLALALDGQDRDEVLSGLVELLARRAPGMKYDYDRDLHLSIITAAEPGLRNQSLEGACAGLSPGRLARAVRRSWTPSAGAARTSTSGSAPCSSSTPSTASTCPPSSNDASRFTHHVSRSLIPFKGYEHLLQRRFEEAIDHFLAVQQAEGPSDAISSALAAAYHRLAFQTLADQVRRSVRSVRGNQWMFRMGHPADHPLRLRPELLRPEPGRRHLPDPARMHPGAHGPHALRLERHLLPGHGFPRRAPRCSTSPLTWGSTGAMPRRARPSRPTCA